MSENISSLQPQSIWKNFAAINAIPRPSKKEEKIIDFMMKFGQSLGLETTKDEVGNVKIEKPATAGMEERQTVCLQSHLDMVCQKNNETKFDFDTQGIQMFVEDGFVKAKGTTLGADNGIGVAAIMSILESDDIEHPAIEALFTIDEETGMTGAKNLQEGWINADILLNLDTEEDNHLDIGCAGGIDVTGERTYNIENTPQDYTTYELNISGLKGGHSGADIHKNYANANKLMGRILFELRDSIVIHEIDGGGLRNAIPREAKASFSYRNENLQDLFSELKHDIINEYTDTEFDVDISLSKIDTIESALSAKDSESFTIMLEDLFNGVYLYSKDIPDLVEASNNVARVLLKDGKSSIMCLTRSSVDASKMELANKLKSTMEAQSYQVTFSGDYPGWQPNPHSPILKVMKSVYSDLFQEEPIVESIHAGLECGLIGSAYPQLDMISFGPNIYGAHSPDERAEVKSVEKFWKYLQAVLHQIPHKN